MPADLSGGSPPHGSGKGILSPPAKTTWFPRQAQATHHSGCILSSLQQRHHLKGVYISMRLKYVCLLVFVLLIAVAFAGCNFIDYTYSLDQSMDNIQKVEIRLYDYESDSTSFVMELDLQTAKDLLTGVTALTCHKPFGDHSFNYGPVVLYITYANGEAEALGRLNSASIDSNGKWWIKTYYFNGIEWCSTVLKYVDSELVPELVEDLERCKSVYD